jgi:RNA polymerase sigma factor (sigma-70 family)
LNPNELDELIKGCHRNDRVAQENLYKYFYADMFRTCQRYTDDPHLALTMLNDAFLKVFRGISQFNHELGGFKAWLKTIIINTAIDHTRKLKKEAHIIHIDLVQEKGDEDFHLNYQWKQEEILQHLKLLPPITRVVMNLFAFDGYTHKDISEQLNISETTSRWHVAEGRKRLKKSMQMKQSKLAKYE